MQRDPADYTGTMAHGRSPLLLLVALAALFALPASAWAQGDPNLPVNTTAPAPAAWQTSPYVVTLEGTDVEDASVDIEWRLGAGGAVSSVPSGSQITIADLGVLDLQTQAVDDSGNTSGWRSEQLRIDTVDPTDATNPGPTAWYAAPATVDVSAVDITSGVDHVEWQLDGGLTQTGPNGSDVAIAGDGTHLLRTRAVDVAGNVAGWTDHTIRVDTVTPADTTAIPGGWQTAPLGVSVTGTDAHSGVVEATWRVDGGSSTTAPAPGALTVSAEGVHTVETRVRDAAGNQTGWKSQTVRIDTTAPTNQTDTSDGVWTTADYSVLVKAADGGSQLAEVQWRIDAGPWISGSSGSQANVTGTGDHTLETRAADVAGNVSVPRLDHVRIDRVNPTNTTAPAPGGAVGNPYQVAVTGTDAHAGVASVEWQVDSDAVESGPSGAQATVSGHGPHTLKTRVIDGAGNASAWRTDTITIDAVSGDVTAPADTTTAAPAGWRPTAIPVTVAATDAGSGVAELQWRVDGQPMQTSLVSNPSFSITGGGQHLLETRAIDVAGNVSNWRAQTFRIDVLVPLDTTDIPADWQPSNSFTLAATDAHSGIDAIEYTIDGGAVQQGTNGQVVTVGADGTYTVATRAIDEAGHATAFKTATLRSTPSIP
jgi:hypothetical protein